MCCTNAEEAPCTGVDSMWNDGLLPALMLDDVLLAKLPVVKGPGVEIARFGETEGPWFPVGATSKSEPDATFVVDGVKITLNTSSRDINAASIPAQSSSLLLLEPLP